ncbi:hypothetical protein [Saccharothrix algeriensis]|uniref:Uncharacterized protein n=1 Tax=Saccharothrix algeriensis TaxID=173560 RepID=A0A8T8HWH0_9PSEU|nr:hypothetical protein [Saccharothrix algeriensis]MBM7814539.1 hypothetical protein [Saccharothrix algeriensis]QTR02836.1 hypothetical protein J7S33_28070 [Saccharothrix algeriensis]
MTTSSQPTPATAASHLDPYPHAFRPGRGDPAVPTFGGAHRCSGQAISVGAASVVRGWEPPVRRGYRPSPNTRTPVLEGPAR